MDDKFFQLKKIDWGFSDYRGSTTANPDINIVHWYPAPFIPQIPALLIQSLTKKEDLILDPFAGSGVTLIEAARLKRNFIGVDINPFALNIIQAKLKLLGYIDLAWFQQIEEEINNKTLLIESNEDYCKKNNISEEVIKWFHKNTLKQLFCLHSIVKLTEDPDKKLIKKVIFSSILLKICSQRKTYTHITDRCFPKELIDINAFEAFKIQLKNIRIAIEEFRKQYEAMHDEEYQQIFGSIILGDSRDLHCIEDKSIQLVITSPPYLGVSDYILSMSLSELFFPEEGTEFAKKNEIGARRRRFRKNAYDEYIKDMDQVFAEVSRVLKDTGYFCMTIGQSRGKISKEDVIIELLTLLQEKYNFEIKLNETRKISSQKIQMKSIGSEKIIILGKRQ